MELTFLPFPSVDSTRSAGWTCFRQTHSLGLYGGLVRLTLTCGIVAMTSAAAGGACGRAVPLSHTAPPSIFFLPPYTPHTHTTDRHFMYPGVPTVRQQRTHLPRTTTRVSSFHSGTALSPVTCSPVAAHCAWIPPAAIVATFMLPLAPRLAHHFYLPAILAAHAHYTQDIGGLTGAIAGRANQTLPLWRLCSTLASLHPTPTVAAAHYADMPTST